MSKIKICGLYRTEDIAYVNAASPDYCGFIINFPKSHRNVSSEKVRALRAQVRDGIVPVGVFVDQDLQDVAALLNDHTISIAQLHGHEDNTYIAALRSMAPGCTIWKAFNVRSAEDLAAARLSTADMVLLDNGYGTGKCFDWQLVGEIQRPFILAGGLTPENIPDAIRQLHPWGIDISSGVETDKIKDEKKMMAAVAAAREE